MTMRRTFALLLVAALCVGTITPALAAPGDPTGTPAAPSPTPAVKGQVPAAAETQRPAIQEALKDLERTKTLLAKDSNPDAQGHRAKAIQDIDQAMQHLRLALQVDKK
jgi:ABC-type sugar transport system substrate-binding protein